MDFVEDIKHGAVFIYPTDTIYGLGCDATNGVSVQRIKDLKYRDSDKPMSIIAPSVDWIKENCEVSDEIIEKYLEEDLKDKKPQLTYREKLLKAFMSKAKHLTEGYNPEKIEFLMTVKPLDKQKAKEKLITEKNISIN